MRWARPTYYRCRVFSDVKELFNRERLQECMMLVSGICSCYIVRHDRYTSFVLLHIEKGRAPSWLFNLQERSSLHPAYAGWVGGYISNPSASFGCYMRLLVEHQRSTILALTRGLQISGVTADRRTLPIRHGSLFILEPCRFLEQNGDFLKLL